MTLWKKFIENTAKANDQMWKDQKPSCSAVKKSNQMKKRLVRPERIRFGHILKESHTYNINE